MVTHNILINSNPNIPLYRTDKGMLEQVVYNLLSNAILYTDPGSGIDVIAASHTDILQISIEDNGPGWPKD